MNCTRTGCLAASAGAVLFLFVYGFSFVCLCFALSVYALSSLCLSVLFIPCFFIYYSHCTCRATFSCVLPVTFCAFFLYRLRMSVGKLRGILSSYFRESVLSSLDLIR